MRRLTRTRLGPHFSEAARRLWLALPESVATQRHMAKLLGVTSGHISHLLYGDRLAGRELALRMQAHLGIDPSLWDQTPAEPFTLPAVAVAEAARAKLAAAEAELQAAGKTA